MLIGPCFQTVGLQRHFLFYIGVWGSIWKVGLAAGYVGIFFRLAYWDRYSTKTMIVSTVIEVILLYKKKRKIIVEFNRYPCKYSFLINNV